jgi:uncharacterized protein
MPHASNSLSLPILSQDEVGGSCRRSDGGRIADLTVHLLRAPRTVALELILTEACNMGCTYCFEYGADMKAVMSSRTAFKAIELLIGGSGSSKWVSICFMGGEPMLQYDLLRECVGHAEKEAAAAGKAVYFTMQTNGLLIREDHARFLCEHKILYCLSLDGARATNDRHRKTLGGSGTFQVVAGKIRMLKRYQPWQGARITVTPEDAGRLGENIRLLHEENLINQFVIGFASHVEWRDDQIADYRSGLIDVFEYYLDNRFNKNSRRLRIGLFEIGDIESAYEHLGTLCWGCGAGSGRFAVAPDGTIHGCSKLSWAAPGREVETRLPLGAVEEGFTNVGNRQKLLDHSSRPRVKCHSCEIAAYCNGGCYAANLADTGHLYVPADYYCKLMFVQKDVSDYAKARLKAIGIKDCSWKQVMPDLMSPV